MRPTDVLKLYYLKHGKLVIDRRFAIEKWKERAQEHAQTGDT